MAAEVKKGKQRIGHPASLIHPAIIVTSFAKTRLNKFLYLYITLYKDHSVYYHHQYRTHYYTIIPLSLPELLSITYVKNLQIEHLCTKLLEMKHCVNFG
jgi:hypothetical protein